VDSPNLKVLILGHNGMLGHVVHLFLKQNKIDTRTINYRWPSIEFVNEIINSNDDFLINCIGSIPQKETECANFISNNFLLPVFLSSFFKNKIIHASSDCEDLDNNKSDFYTQSKTKAFEILNKKNNVAIIKTSIIGPEIFHKKSLWEWISNTKEQEIFGYTNHFWNGITTLEWSKIALMIIKKEIDIKLINVGTSSISKFNLLHLLNKKLNLNKTIIPLENTQSINKIINSNLIIDEIDKQIDNMIIWYPKQ
jgi:dTDP-4-dehydrorhamnose reductase